MTVKGTNYVNGRFQETRDLFPSINPATEEIIGHFPQSTSIHVCEAVQAARKAFKSWRSLSRIKRAEYFERLITEMYAMQDVVVEAISKETGKSLNESKAEFMESLHMAQYTFAQGREPFGQIVASEIAEKDVTIFRKPKGVVAVIAPWNFPCAISGFWTSAPALLEGNTVVMKPSEDTPYVGWLISNLYHRAGFPEGVFNVIHGDGKVGAALVEDDVDHICFTGSAAVGKYIRRGCAESWHKTCSCEMGSKSAVIVFDDADMDLAINSCVASAYKLSGQRCVSSGRMLVQRRALSEFCDQFVAASENIKIGDPSKGDFFMGPLINETQMKNVLRYNEMTKGEADILLEGKRIGDRGFFLSPHVYVSEWDNTRSFLVEEVFGPHVAIIPFNDVEDAVEIYNDTDYGLSMACITRDMYKARYMRDNCDFGLGYLNLPSIGAESHIPFGGVKKSGSGGSSAAGTFRAVTHEVTWTANYQHDGFTFCQGMK